MNYSYSEASLFKDHSCHSFKKSRKAWTYKRHAKLNHSQRNASMIVKVLQLYPLSPQQFARINGPACNTSQVGRPWDDMALVSNSWADGCVESATVPVKAWS